MKTNKLFILIILSMMVFAVNGVAQTITIDFETDPLPYIGASLTQGGYSLTPAGVTESATRVDSGTGEVHSGSYAASLVVGDAENDGPYVRINRPSSDYIELSDFVSISWWTRIQDGADDASNYVTIALDPDEDTYNDLWVVSLGETTATGSDGWIQKTVSLTSLCHVSAYDDGGAYQFGGRGDLGPTSAPTHSPAYASGDYGPIGDLFSIGYDNTIPYVAPTDYGHLGINAFYVGCSEPGTGNKAWFVDDVQVQLSSEVWVNDDYVEGSCGGHTWGYDAFDNIQEGIDAVSDGGTVNVATGTYTENLTIDKSLDLLGAGLSTIIDGSLGGGALGSCIDIYASNVLVDGFKIMNGTYGMYIGGGAATYDYITVSNCEVTANSKYGIQAIGLSNNNHSYIIFDNVYAHDNDRNGIKIFACKNSEIKNCQITNNGDVSNDDEKNYGIWFGSTTSGSGMLIDLQCFGNSFSGNVNGSIILMDAPGPSVFTGAAIYNNDFSGDVTIGGYGVYNAHATLTLTLDATCNWWGSTDPYAVTDATFGNVQFLPFSTAASPTNCDGVGPVVNITQTLSYLTIQDAIDAATAGDFIEIAAGTYYEEVSIVGIDNLTITGAGEGNTIIAPYREFTTDNYGFTIDNADGITIQQLTVDGFANAALTLGVAHYKDGVHWGNIGGSDCVITYVTVDNTDRRGISVWPETVTNNEITYCTIDNVTGVTYGYGQAIKLCGSGKVENCNISNATAGILGNNNVVGGTYSIQNNVITNLTGLTSTPFDIGLNFWCKQSNVITVKNNQITANVADNNGIYVVRGGDGSEISGNTINLTGDGGCGIETGWENAWGFPIHTNTITMGKGGTGILVTGAGTDIDPMLIYNNDLSNVGSDDSFSNDYTGGYSLREVGLLLSGSKFTSRTGDADYPFFGNVYDNTVDGFKDGIVLVSDSYDVGGFNQVEILLSDNNSFTNYEKAARYGYDIAVFVEIDVNDPNYLEQDLSKNYWGSALPDFANVIDGKIDYSPWLGATPGTSPMTWYTNDSIQDAIDAADPSDVINVAAGTYAEPLYIAKQLDIRGPNYGINPNIASRNPEATIKFPPSNTSWYLLYIDGDGGGSTVTDVSLNGFEFNGIDYYADTTELIFVAGAENVTIKNNILKNFVQIAIRFYQGYYDGSNWVTTYPSGAIVSDNHISNPDFYSIGSIAPNTGIYMQGVYGSVTGNVVEDVLGACQIQPYNHPNTLSVTGTVSGNTFKGSRNGLWYNNSSHADADWLFSGNTLSGIPYPSGYTPSADWYSEPADIWYGFAINGNSYGEVAFTNNTIEAGTTTLETHGIRYVHGYAHAPKTSITYNTIEDLDYGIYLPLDLVNVGEIVINNNSISGNSQYGVYNGTVTDVDASPNWWGDPAGPTPPGSRYGNAVSTNVDYEPYWEDEAMTDLSAEVNIYITADETLLSDNETQTYSVIVSEIANLRTFQIGLKFLKTDFDAAPTLTLNELGDAFDSYEYQSIFAADSSDATYWYYEITGGGAGLPTHSIDVSGTDVVLFTVQLTTADGASAPSPVGSLIDLPEEDAILYNNFNPYAAMTIDATTGMTVYIDSTEPDPIVWVHNRPTADSNNSIDLEWTNPASDVEYLHVWALNYKDLAGASDYPQYNPAVFSVPAIPWPDADDDDGIDGNWTRLTNTEIGNTYNYTGMNRGYYYFTLFVEDAAGNMSDHPAELGECLSYWPGDVNATPDSLVNSDDIALLSAVWGTDGSTNPVCDVGPAVGNYRLGRPTPDDVINIEDLMIFAMNYLNTDYTVYRSEDSSEPVSIGIELEYEQIENEIVATLTLLQNSGFVKALNIPIRYGNSLEFVSVETSEIWPNETFFNYINNDNILELSGSVLGGNNCLEGNGLVATIHFQITGPRTDLNLEHMTARTGSNDDIEIIDNPELTGNDNELVIPIKDVLGDNYPNPFNPTTTINYGLKEETKVNITLYNIRGQKIKTLINEIMSAGNHQVLWNGRDDNNKKVASGVYFYSMKTKDYTKVHKAMLLK